MKIKKICVYCGSSPGKSPAYSVAAKNIAKALCDREIGLVYGGGAIGVMGAVADAVLEAGGEAIGVIPKSLAIKEVAHENLRTFFRIISTICTKAAITNIYEIVCKYVMSKGTST